MSSVRVQILSRLRRSWLAPIIGGLAVSVPCCWVRRPTILDGDQICLFVTYARDGNISNHALFHARSWAEAGFKVNLTVVLDELENFTAPSDLEFAAGVLLRENKGYDFGAWAATILRLPDLEKASLLCIANDSVYGPFANFSTMLERAVNSDADVIGLTESYQITRHFQSYIIFFRHKAIVHRAFGRFWRNVKTGGRLFVIENYELKLLLIMEQAGLRAVALYPTAEKGSNPTLTCWRELIMSGFPFVKVQLLRDNPFAVNIEGWDILIRERGFDPNLIRDHLKILGQNRAL